MIIVRNVKEINYKYICWAFRQHWIHSSRVTDLQKKEKEKEKEKEKNKIQSAHRCFEKKKKINYW